MKGGKSSESKFAALLPQKRKLPRKFRVVEVDEDELQENFQMLGIEEGNEEEEEEEEEAEEESIYAGNSELMQELEERLLSNCRLASIEEQKILNNLGSSGSKRRKF